ncbi:MAG: hypothetical protein AAB581_02325, partial [Patescibacteria group bacterium]
MTFETFFNSEIKARLIKFFVYNGGQSFRVPAIAARLDVPTRLVKKPLAELAADGFVKGRVSSGFSVNRAFPFLEDIKLLVLEFPPITDGRLIKEANKIGRMKLLIVAG